MKRPAPIMRHEAHAVLSECGTYRYWLHRTWPEGKGFVVFVMLNPSTADAKVSDPTLRRCVAFAHSWGYAGVIVVNMYAARATEPDDLLEMDDPIGPENMKYIDAAIELADEVVVAWGQHRMVFRRKRELIDRIYDKRKRMPRCLRMTKAGHPEHPLYIPANTKLVPYHG